MCPTRASSAACRSNCCAASGASPRRPAIGFAIATFARSQLAGLGAGIALYFVEQFSTLFLPDIVRYLPFHVAASALRVTPVGAGNGGGAALIAPLDPNFALVLVTVYLVVAAAATALIVERAEITG